MGLSLDDQKYFKQSGNEQSAPISFSDVDNAKIFLSSTTGKEAPEAQVKEENPSQKINQYLNDIYNEIAKEAFELDGY